MRECCLHVKFHLNLTSLCVAGAPPKESVGGSLETKAGVSSQAKTAPTCRLFKKTAASRCGSLRGGAAASSAAPPDSTAGGHDDSSQKPEAPAEPPSKFARSSKGAAEPAGGVSLQASDPGKVGVSLPHSDAHIWLVQKALKLHRGVPIDDPANAQWRTDCFPHLDRTRHSTTWRAFPQPGRAGGPVILKAHHEICAGELIDEVHFLSQLRHPNIIELMDVSFISGKNCMVLADGGANLCRWTRDTVGGPPCSMFETLAPQLLEGVQYVHSCSIVHCDLKPANMVVSPTGVLRLIDFGCAFVDLPGHRQVRSYESIENHGLFYGTTPYRAIEIALGAADFGKPADMWSVGCCCFEMLVCKGLFRSDIKDPELVPECFAQFWAA